jgi:transposase InsO family protein
MAIAAKQPGPGLIHHSDKGVQYASEDYRKVINSVGLQASMSRKADCYDNAAMENFFRTLKTELVHHRYYGFCNQTRRHSASATSARSSWKSSLTLSIFRDKINPIVGACLAPYTFGCIEGRSESYIAAIQKDRMVLPRFPPTACARSSLKKNSG